MDSYHLPLLFYLHWVVALSAATFCCSFDLFQCPCSFALLVVIAIEYKLPSSNRSFISRVQICQRLCVVIWVSQCLFVGVSVLCSAGIGRTGTFIAIDAMLNRAESMDTLDVFGYCAVMRTMRNYMVQVEVSDWQTAMDFSMHMVSLFESKRPR